MAVFLEYWLTCMWLTPGTLYEKIWVALPAVLMRAVMTNEPLAALACGILSVITVPAQQRVQVVQGLPSIKIATKQT